jgi:hypothetical protein
MLSFPYLIWLLNRSLIGLDAESAFVGIEIKQGNFLTGVSCGDSPLYVIRDGRILRINCSTNLRLGTCRPDIYWIGHALKKHDVIVAASDGFALDRHRLVETVQRHMHRPSEMAEALLNAQADRPDDVTVITKLVSLGSY